MIQIEEDPNVTVAVEGVAVSVASPDMDDTEDVLLGVVQSASSKDSDLAEVTFNLLKYFDIVDQIFSVFCDTTSNSGVHSGAIILSSILNIPLL